MQNTVSSRLSPTLTSQTSVHFHRPQTNDYNGAWMHFGETSPSYFSINGLPLRLTTRPPPHVMPEYPNLIDYYLEAVTPRPQRLSLQRKGSARRRRGSSKQRRRLRLPRTRRRPRLRRNARKKRYMYEDVYDWDYEATELDYEVRVY